ncbi:hypothetical protein [Brasilonema sp. UFV-L1]|uniref:hypothetical protein n=1 Tax=Brasilonema sp. UFV-L1 TaxID=2234130 RepID=UPI00145FC1F4|nr:hypothetical protein [Brasilonema sp. UFV-L1]NMG09960.1 hypothetical protein [Brasilonema sp. UFV-L1]
MSSSCALKGGTEQSISKSFKQKNDLSGTSVRESNSNGSNQQETIPYQTNQLPTNPLVLFV